MEWVAQGCQDPLVLYLAAHLDFWVHDNWRRVEDHLSAALKQPESDASLARSLAWCVAVSLAEVKKRGNYDDKPLYQKAMSFLR